MALNSKRPDTPLAITPEPQPVSMGQSQQMQPMIPKNKFQVTADTAIQELNVISKMNAPAPVEKAAPQPPIK